MGDENPIHTLGDYSRPSHEGYRNTIRLVQNGCSFHGLWSKDPNQHLKDFLKLVDSLDLDGENMERMRLLDTLMKDAISLMGKSESVFRLATNEMYQPLFELSRQEEFEHIVMNFILDQEERIRQLEDYMQAITDEFVEFSSEVTQRLKERIKENKNKPKKIIKITRYPDTEDLEPLNDHKFLETLTKEVPSDTPKIVSLKSLCVKHVCTILHSPPLVRESTFGFKPVEEIIGIPIEVEPFDKILLEDLGLNTYNHDIPLSSREILNFDEPEPQPQPLLNFPSLDESLGNETGPEPPIEPHIPKSFRMKVVDNLTIHMLLLPHVASSYPKNMYCNYHPCLDYPKRHYGFKPGLSGCSGSLGVDFSKLEIIEDD
ncbi:hypothetical protein Tco_0321313 [Tanacetum coccineum]